MTCVALALRPEQVEVEFRRCTGHCCRPVMLDRAPGELAMSWEGELLSELLVYLGWRPPSRGGWAKVGTHEYHCRAQEPDGACSLHGTRHKPYMCTGYPGYGRGKICLAPGCTRRTLVLNSLHPGSSVFPEQRGQQ